MNKKSGIVLLLAVILIAGAAVFYFLKQSPQQTANTAAPIHNMDMDTQMKTVELKGFNTGFSPQEIKLKLGEMVSIKLTSNDSPHTFTIDELGINKQFTWGEDTSVEFTPDRKGTFQYYCAVPGHKEGGMVGTLIVE